MGGLFAKCEMHLGHGVVVQPNHRIPEDKLKPGAREELLARGLAMEVDSQPTPEKPAAPPPPSPLEQGAWAFDPASVAKDSLDILNMKIQGHVQRFGLAKVEPFDDIEEARAFVSLEWQNG